MSKVSRFISIILTVVLLSSIATPVIGANAADTSTDGTYTIETEIQDEAGAEHQRSVDFIKTAVLEVSGGNITANITVASGVSRTFTFKGATDVNTAVTNDDGTQTYSVPINNITDRLPIEFVGGSNTLTIYVKFNEETLESSSEISDEIIDADGNIADGKYTIQTTSKAEDSEDSYSPSHKELAVLEVEGGVITAYIRANSENALTFTNVNFEDVTDGGDVLTYKLDIEDINEAVYVNFRDRYTYRLFFETSTIKIYDEADLEEDDLTDKEIHATHTIEASLSNTANGNLSVLGKVLVVIEGDTVYAYATVTGRALVSPEVYALDSEGNRIYQFVTNTKFDPADGAFRAGGSNTGGVATQLVFDKTTLQTMDGTPVAIEDDQPIIGEDGTIADGIYAIKTKALNVTEDVAYAPKHKEVAVLTVTGGVIKATVRANSADVLTFTGIQSRDITDGDVLTYELDIEDINEPILVGYRDRYTYRLVFDLDTIKVFDESDIDDDGSNYVINATHTIKASFSNTSVTGLAIVGDALVEVTDEGIFVYLTVEGRALVGSELVIENPDETKVYKLEVNSNYDPVTVRFIAGGAPTGSVEIQVLFDKSTLKAINDTDTGNDNDSDTGNDNDNDTDTGNDNDTDNDDNAIGKFTVSVEAQNEDGTVNELRNAHFDPDAIIEVSKGSLVAYITVGERELFFRDADGNFGNDIVSTKDGKNTYKLVLNNLTDRIVATFPISGSNPNYSSGSIPLFYIAFSAEEAVLQRIADIYNGVVIPGADDVINDDDDGNDNDTGNNNDTGNDNNTGNDTNNNTTNNNTTNNNTTNNTTNNNTTNITTTDTTKVPSPKTGDVSLSTAIILIIASLSGIAFTLKRKPLLNRN